MKVWLNEFYSFKLMYANKETLVFYSFTSSEQVASVVQKRKCEDFAACHKAQATYVLFQFRSPIK